ncbi:MAG: hypothetical protein RL367_301 [Pseudomonadota bacterium]
MTLTAASQPKPPLTQRAIGPKARFAWWDRIAPRVQGMPIFPGKPNKLERCFNGLLAPEALRRPVPSCFSGMACLIRVTEKGEGLHAND